MCQPQSGPGGRGAGGHTGSTEPLPPRSSVHTAAPYRSSLRAASCVGGPQGWPLTEVQCCRRGAAPLAVCPSRSPSTPPLGAAGRHRAQRLLIWPPCSPPVPPGPPPRPRSSPALQVAASIPAPRICSDGLPAVQSAEGRGQGAVAGADSALIGCCCR